MPTSVRTQGYAVAALCAASFLLFPLYAALDKRDAFVAFREAPLESAIVLFPFAVTMIVCILSPNTFTFGLAMGVGFVAGLALLVAVPFLGLVLQITPESNHGGSFVVFGIVLFAVQVMLYKTANAGLSAARELEQRRATSGVAFAPGYVAFVFLFVLPAVERLHRRRAEAESQAFTLAREERQRALARDPAVAQRAELTKQLQIIGHCIELRTQSTHRNPPDLRALGPGGDNCLDSSLVSGTIGKWRVTYLPSARTSGLVQFELRATDTTSADAPVIYSFGDASTRPAAR